MKNERERQLWGEAIMVQMVILSGFMECKPILVGVSETGFLIPTTESC
jgi:hypothetical protein